MADFTYDGPADVREPAGRRVANVANWAGAAVSLALVVGVGIWGYKLLVRDVTGIPVVQAMEGPMRVAPEDPGGTLADHQGLAVNDVAGTGTATPVPDRLMLAPVQAGLTDDDLPAEELAALLAPVPEPIIEEEPEMLAEGEAEDIDEELGDAAAEAAMLAEQEGLDPIEALANQIAADTVPFTEMEQDGDPEVLTSVSDRAEADEPSAAEQLAALRAAPPGALVRSLRPLQRPTALTTENAAAATLAGEEETSEVTNEVDPSTLPAGTRLAQLGAYDSPETARSEWERFSTRFGEFMAGKDRVIERATSGGRVFYRLRAAGFEDLSAARRFCAAFVAENADCIPVTTR